MTEKPNHADCVSCGRYLPVANDSGYRDLPNGLTEHDDPMCEECSPSPLAARWDGMCVAGGVYQRCE